MEVLHGIGGGRNKWISHLWWRWANNDRREIARELPERVEEGRPTVASLFGSVFRVTLISL